MHGRVKIRTTAEQDAIKAAERKEKSGKYLKLRGKLMAMAGEDSAVVSLSEAMLSVLPDFGSVWNWRREALGRVLSGMVNDKARQVSCEKELVFLNECLGKNPKSYGVVSHASAAAVEVASAENEFEFTLGKISDNFSNYSAWHYRSTLLPLARRGDDGQNGVAASALADEFETVASAFYIEPTDQSAWFYHRWLLGRNENVPRLCSVHGGRCRTGEPFGDPGTGEASAAVGSLEMNMVFSHPTFIKRSGFTCTIDGLEVPGVLAPACRGNSSIEMPSTVWTWTFIVPPSQDAQVKIAFNDTGLTAVSGSPCGPCESPTFSVGSLFAGGGDEVESRPAAVLALPPKELAEALPKYVMPDKELLRVELNGCRELLKELEGPERKWALMAVVYILYGLVEGIDEIFETLEELVIIDPPRAGYYRDLASMYRCECLVITAAEATVRDTVPDTTHCGLSGDVVLRDKRLTTLHHLQHWSAAKSLDLSSNGFSRVAGLSSLRQVVRLVLDDNAITGVYSGEMDALTSLEELSLARNKIMIVRGLSGLVQLNLKVLLLTGNPVLDTDEFQAFSAQLPGLTDTLL